jgi:cytochrome c-type biogenesis protein
VISFSSPCCLPLLPGYLSYLSGLPVSELDRRQARAASVRAAVGFVVGFSAVFTALGVAAGLAGAVITRELPLILRGAGLVIIVMGLAMIGVLRIPVLYRERRFDLARTAAGGPRAAAAMGAAFAFGWAPCIGPVLATILATAAATRTAIWGGVLLALYSLGLGLPFIALAVGFSRAQTSTAWLRRHARAVETTGGIVLVIVGVSFVTGAWRGLFVPLQRWFARFGWPPV